MKTFGFAVFLTYSLNFAGGYFAVKRQKPVEVCQKIMAEAHGWALLAIMALLPGEANACLDLGVFPTTQKDRKDG